MVSSALETMRKTMQTPWLTLRETASYLKLSKETIYRHVYSKSSTLPIHRVGKVYLFHRDELDRWVMATSKLPLKVKRKK